MPSEWCSPISRPKSVRPKTLGLWNPRLSTKDKCVILFVTIDFPSAKTVLP